MKKTFLFFLMLFVGCSSHIEKGFLSEKEYLTKINNKLNDEHIVVNYSNNKTAKGKFIRIDSNILLISKSGELIEINKKDISSIKYNDDSILLGSLGGGLVGFVAGLLVVKISGATINFGGGSKNQEYFLAIPFTTLAGTIWGGVNASSYDTIEFNKKDSATKK